MSQNRLQFYIVWEPTGRTPAPEEYSTIEAAIQDAEQLAGLYPDKAFYILKAIKVSRFPRFITEDLQPFDQRDARPGCMGGGARPGY